MFFLIGFVFSFINYVESEDKLTLTINGDEGITRAGVIKNGLYNIYEKIILKGSIPTIEQSSFSNCVKLKHITLLPTIKILPYNCFASCSALPHIDIPTGVEIIMDSCFIRCNSLLSFNLPSTVHTLSASSFPYCKLQKIQVDENSNFFYSLHYNSILVDNESTAIIAAHNETIFIPSAVKAIGKSFARYSNLKKIIFEGASVTSIQSSAFSDTNLDSIALPSSLLHLGSSIFTSTPLKSITIPSSLLTTMDDVFAGSSLESVIVEEGCIGMKQSSPNGAVYNATQSVIIFLPASITSIDIPKDLTGIATMALQNSKNLSTLTVNSSESFSAHDNALYNKEGTNLIASPGGVTSIHIYAECQMILKKAFRDTNIQEVVFDGEKVHTIQEEAFYGCKSLVDIKFRKGLKYIGIYAFSQSNLENLEIIFPETILELKHNSLEKNNAISLDFGNCKERVLLGVYCFDLCKKLQKLILPPLLLIISEGLCRCTGLKEIVIPSEVTTISSISFKEANSLSNVTFAPNSTLKKISRQAFFGTNISSIALPDSVNSLGHSSFGNCKNLASFYISEESLLEELDSQVFIDCDKLTNLSFGRYLRTIKTRALAQIPSLLEIHVLDSNDYFWSSEVGLLFSKNKSVLYQCPGGKESAFVQTEVEYIGDSAFYNCRKLRSVDFGSNSKLIALGAFTFWGCSFLQNVSIPGNVSELSSSAFAECSRLQLVEIGDNSKIRKIGSGCFANCSVLQSIVFGEGSNLEALGSYVFYGCRELRSINLPDRLKSISERAFANSGLSGDLWLPPSLRSIGLSTFEGCTKLSRIFYCSNSTDGMEDVDAFGTNKKTQVIVSIEYESNKLFGRLVLPELDHDCRLASARFTLSSDENTFSLQFFVSAIMSCEGREIEVD